MGSTSDYPLRDVLIKQTTVNLRNSGIRGMYMRTTVSLLVFFLISLPLSGCIEQSEQGPECWSGHDNQFEELTNGTSGELNLTAIEESRRNSFVVKDVTGVLFAIEQSEFDVDDEFMVMLDGVEYDKDELIDDGIPAEAYFIWETDTRSRCGSPHYATQFGNVSIDGVDYWGIHVQDRLYHLDRENPEYESNLNVSVFVHFYGIASQT